MEVEVSVIIATYNRVASLRRLLETLYRFGNGVEVEHEVVVANNASDEATRQTIECLVAEFAARGASHFRHVREPRAGKCRAQNRAIADAKGSILAFLDDDVEVTPQWLRATADFFSDSRFHAMQGPILVPTEIANNAEFLRVYHRYRTIPFVKYGPNVMEIKTLTGGNMAVQRELFSQIGLFDERLGPGRSGISEDVEFAQRIIRAGKGIGYEPKAAVYHEVDWSRLTEQFFRLRHEDQGRSRLLYKHTSVFRITPDFVRSIFAFGWYSLVCNERKKYRAKGRYFHYKAMLQEKIKWLFFSRSTYRQV